MQIFIHKSFAKQYKKLTSIQLKIHERLKVFRANPYDQTLSNHALRGKYAGYRSINITGDYRAIYRKLSRDSVSFIAIGTHTELYD